MKAAAIPASALEPGAGAAPGAAPVATTQAPASVSAPRTEIPPISGDTGTSAGAAGDGTDAMRGKFGVDAGMLRESCGGGAEGGGAAKAMGDVTNAPARPTQGVAGVTAAAGEVATNYDENSSGATRNVMVRVAGASSLWHAGAASERCHLW